MSRSFRKPYSTWTTAGAKNSAHDDKTVAARCFRRAQNQALRECTDYEELMLPVRHEASYNNVYSWKRDGKQRERHFDHGDFNVFDGLRKDSMYDTYEKAVNRLEDHLAWKEDWLVRLKRK